MRRCFTMDDLPQGHRRTLRDYRMAFGLAVTHLRESAGLSVKGVAEHTGIPEQTLRSYERGDSQPQMPRLLALARTLNSSAFDLLIDTSKYIYRACGRPFPEPVSTYQAKLAAVLLFCGVSPDDISELLNKDI